MDGCSLEKLVLLLDKKLDLDTRLGIYDHLDRCYHCKDAIYRLVQSRDRKFLIYHSAVSRRESVA